MTTDLFDPFAIDFEIQNGNRVSGNLRSAVTDLFTAVVEGTTSHQPAFVGHIKAFCKGDGDDYLRISYVSANTGIDIAGEWSGDPDRVRLTMNVHVLGVQRDEIEHIVKVAVGQINESGKATISPIH